MFGFRDCPPRADPPPAESIGVLIITRIHKLTNSQINESRFGAKLRNGYTLIEILLVLVIVGIMAAVTMPSLVKSMSGNRLRVAARGIVTAGRYARTMAVLSQKEVRLVINLETTEISVKPSAEFEAELIAEKETLKKDEEGEDAPIEEPDEPDEALDDGMLVENDFSIESKFERVVIDRVVMDGGENVVTEGQCSILYERNGRCAPYKVVLTDDDGLSVTINVDAIASAKTVAGDVGDE